MTITHGCASAADSDETRNRLKCTFYIPSFPWESIKLSLIEE